MYIYKNTYIYMNYTHLYVYMSTLASPRNFCFSCLDKAPAALGGVAHPKPPAKHWKTPSPAEPA